MKWKGKLFKLKLLGKFIKNIEVEDMYINKIVNNKFHKHHRAESL